MVFGTPPWQPTRAQARHTDADVRDTRVPRPSLLPDVSSDSLEAYRLPSRPAFDSSVSGYDSPPRSDTSAHAALSYFPNPTVTAYEMARLQLETEKVKLEQLKVEAQRYYERAAHHSTTPSENAYEQAESLRPKSPTTSEKEQLRQQLELVKLQLQVEETKLARAQLRHSSRSPSPTGARGPATASLRPTDRLGKALDFLEGFAGGNPEDYLAKFIAAASKRRIAHGQWAAEFGLKLEGKADQWLDSFTAVHGNTDNFDHLSAAFVHEFANPWSAAGVFAQYGHPPGGNFNDLNRTLDLQQLQMDRAHIPREICSAETRFYHLQNIVRANPQVLANLQAQMEAHGEVGEAQRRLLEQKERTKSGGRLSITLPSQARSNFFEKRCSIMVEGLKLLSDDQGPGKAHRSIATAGRAAVLDGEPSVTANPQPQSHTDSPRSPAAPAQLLALADHMEVHLCAIIEGRLLREQRSMGPATTGTHLIGFPHYFSTQPECKTEFLRRRTDKLCYACNKDKAECRSGGDVWKYALCPHHGPRVDKSGLEAAARSGLTVKGAGGRDGRGK